MPGSVHVCNACVRASMSGGQAHYTAGSDTHARDSEGRQCGMRSATPHPGIPAAPNLPSSVPHHEYAAAQLVRLLRHVHAGQHQAAAPGAAQAGGAGVDGGLEGALGRRRRLRLRRQPLQLGLALLVAMQVRQRVALQGGRRPGRGVRGSNKMRAVALKEAKSGLILPFGGMPRVRRDRVVEQEKRS